MNLRYLEVFVTVADCGKMNLAAQKLFMSESSVSQTISKLEKGYGIKLFERLNKRIYLTYEGKEFLNYARQILTLESSLESYANELSGTALLRIGVSGSASFYLIHQLAAQLNQMMPRINTILYHYSNKHIQRLIRSGKLDIAIIGGQPHVERDLTIQPIINDKLIIICGKTHPFWERTSVSVQDLQEQPFIIREDSSGTRIAFDQFLDQNNLVIRVKGISNNALYCKCAVQYNPHLTCISKALCMDDIRAGIIKEVPIKDLHLSQDFCLIYHKSKTITPLIATFIHLCKIYNSSDNRVGGSD